MEPAIIVENLYRSFGREEILHGIDHEFEAGRIHGIVGNNGSGKTVLMKCICGFLRPDKGQVTVNGQAVGKDVDFPDSCGVIIETPGFLPRLSGMQNLKILASVRKLAGTGWLLFRLYRGSRQHDLCRSRHVPHAFPLRTLRTVPDDGHALRNRSHRP